MPEKDKSLNLQKLLARFSEIEAILITDHDGIQLASAFAEGGSKFQKKEISTMIVDTLFQCSGAIEQVSKDCGIKSTTMQLPRHLLQLTRIASLAIVLVLRDSRNEALASLISQDLRELYRPVAEQAAKLAH